MKSTGLWVLLALIAAQAEANLFRWGHSARSLSRARREIELHDWLTEDQKKELEPLKDKIEEYRAKVMAFYKQLPEEKQQEWNKFYKKHCVEWLKTVASEEERNELKQLKEKKDKETLLAKIRTYRARLPDDKRKAAEAFEAECLDLWKDELSRKRRDIDKRFEEFTMWMTEEQKKEVSDMKASGKSFDELRKKTIEYFEALPKDKQDSLKEEFKGKCKAFFKKISTPEEMTKMKELHESGNDSEVRSMVKDIISRLSGDEMKLASKMEMLCSDVFAVKHKRRRDINEKINRRLSWMTADQKEEIKRMHASGKSHADIRAKIFEYLSALEGPAGMAAKQQTQKECYKWMEDVATAEEIAALHEMHERDHDGCKKKVREFMARLPADRKTEVEKNLPFCEKVWYGDHEHHGDHDHHGHHGHHRRRRLAERRRRHLHAIDKFLDWLTPEQKATLEELEKKDSEFNNVIAKVKEYYNELPDDKKADLKANFKNQCSAWVKEVATPEEMEKIKEMHKAKNHEGLKKKLAELENRLTEEQKHTVEHVRDVCLGVWEIQNARRRRDEHEHKLDEEMNKYLTWLTPEQKDKVKEKFEKEGREPGYKLIMDFFEASSGDVKTKATEELKAACKHFGKEIIGEENVKTLTQMKESGASHDEMEKKVKEIIAGIEDPKKRERAEKYSEGCKKIYKSSASRRRRGQELYTLEKVLENYLTWLTDAQKAELKSLKEAGNKDEIYKKIVQFFDGTSGDTQKKALEEMQTGCKHYIRNVVGDEKADEFKQMKESGVSVDEIAKKIDAIVDGLTNEEVKAQAKKAAVICKVAFSAPKRFRRDQHEHKLDEEMKKYLTWLTPEQNEKLKEKFEKEGREPGYKLVMEFFEASSGDVKIKAREELKAACKHFSKEVLGEENTKILTEMKESGASHDEMEKKVNEMVAGMTDPKKKERAEKYTEGCKKVYKSSASRRRRGQELYTLEKVLENYLTWLTDAQKAELKSLKEAGNKDEIYKKIVQFFDGTSGDTQKKALEEMRTGCKHYIRNVVGDEKADEFKQMRESGVPVDEIAKKIDAIVDGLTNEEVKAQAKKAAVICKVAFSAPKRFRRDQHEHKLDEEMKKYLTWLTPEQNEKLKEKFEKEGREPGYKLVMEFFEASSGDVKIKASKELKAACKHFGKEIIGEDNVKTLTQLKESGASHDEMEKKVKEIIAGIEDPKKRERAEKYTEGCKKIYKSSASRRRRGQELYTLEKALEHYLTWLTDDQKAELKALKESGNKDDIYKKVLEYYDGASGDVKKKATEELQVGCKHYIRNVLGDEKADEFKNMRESGTPPEEIGKKVEALIDGLDNAEVKAQAKKSAPICKKVFSAPKRFRREQHEHKLDEEMKKYLTWLTPEQNEKLKEKFEKEGREPGYKLVMEFFEASSGDVKIKAREELKAACKHFSKEVLGEENTKILTEMKESGASHDEMEKKVNEMVAGMTDPKKKERAEKYTEGCKKVYKSSASRRRRGQELYTLEKVLENYLTWLTDAQKAELKSLKEAGNKDEIYKKIVQFFDGTSGDTQKKALEEMQTGCKHYIRNVVGDEKADEFKQMKESGVSVDEIAKKIDAIVDGLTNEEVKAQAKKAAVICKVAFSAPKRFRRDQHEHKLDEEMKKYLTWLTPEQNEKLKEKFEKEGREPGYKLVMEFFEASSGDVKIKAREELKAACKHFSKEVLGEENTKILTEMKESGASHDEMEKKVNEMVAGMTDPKKKERAEKYTEGCKKVYKSSASRRRRGQELYTLEKVLENYLTWLTDAQKAELKSLKEAGNKDEIYKKIVQFFDGTSGDTQKKALEEMQTGCKHYIRNVVGDEKADEFKQMKESGVSVDEIAKKIDAIVDGLTNEEVKAQAKKASVICKAAFSSPKRFRRGHHEHSFEEVMENYLNWLSEDQKVELKSIHDAGDKTAVYEKVMEMFDEAEGEKKEKAVTGLKSACRHFVKDLIGNQNAEKLREMKENGSTNDMIATQVEEMIEAIAEEEKKEKAMQTSKYCKKVYNVARRMRRDHHEHTHDFEEAMQKYLTWLTDDQKAEAKKLHEKEGREAVYKKVMEWFDAATGEVKEKATTELKDACKHYMKDHIGEEHEKTIKEMKENGASKEAIAAKVDEFIAMIADEKKKEKAIKASATCKKIYGVSASRMRREHNKIYRVGKRMRREHHEHTLEEGFQKYLTWLTEGQKDELRKLDEKKDEEGLYKKIMEFYDAATGEVKGKATEELKEGCKHHIVDYIGKEKADELKKLKDSGTPEAEIAKKVDEFVDAIADQKVKAKAQKAASGCRKIYGITKVRRHLAARRTRREFERRNFLFGLD